MRRIAARPSIERVSEALFESMRDAWRAASPRFEAYGLVLPGSPSFVCQPLVCTAYCCHAYSVSMGEAEMERFKRFQGLEPVQFLELDEDGTPVTLPLNQPYLLRREDNHCKFLSPELGCSAYHGRPNACRLYPHFVVFWDTEAGTARSVASKRVTASFEAGSRGNVLGLVPLLLGHSECPGFTGPPIAEDAWFELFRNTYQLQYLEA